MLLGIVIMVNKEALERIKALEQKYKEVWGKCVDYTIISKGLSQENWLPSLKELLIQAKAFS